MLLCTAVACSSGELPAVGREYPRHPGAISPFRIDIARTELDDLAERLTSTRWPDELPGVGDEYGVRLDRIKSLAARWRDGYDWREHEARLNSLPQYTTEIDGQRVHFVHVRSSKPSALALILTHGWPGSIVEFLDVIEPLSRDFHVVVPSIPGFGFSGPTSERGWNTVRVARTWAELMRRLGYSRYGAQGGDWGSPISLQLGALDAEHVVGVHVNYLPTPPTPEGIEQLSESDRERVARLQDYLADQPGQRLINTSAPQTVSFALTDSPAGLLAWMVDRFDDWAAPTSAISDDRILTNVTIYWLTRTAASSARLYLESRVHVARLPPTDTPVGVAVFAGDITLSVRALAERRYRIVHWSEFDRGGHFAAMEVPDLFIRDVRAFFSSPEVVGN